MIWTLLEMELTTGNIVEMSKDLGLVGFLIVMLWFFIKKDKEKETKIEALNEKVLTMEVNSTKAITDFTNTMEKLTSALEHNTEVIEDLRKSK